LDFLALKNEVTMDEIAERLHRAHHCGNAAIAVQLQLVNVAHGIVGGPTELAKQSTVVAKVNPQPLGYREHLLQMRHFGQNLFLEPVTEQQRPLLVARRTARPLAARERHEKLLPAVPALDTRKAFLEIAAFQKLVYR
jgi:hypothetical protein